MSSAAVPGGLTAAVGSGAVMISESAGEAGGAAFPSAGFASSPSAAGLADSPSAGFAASPSGAASGGGHATAASTPGGAELPSDPAPILASPFGALSGFGSSVDIVARERETD